MGVRQAVNPHPDRDGSNRGLTYGRIVFSHQVLPHLVVCPASSTPNSKQDLRSPGENHSRCLSLHILRHRVIIRALREWTPSPAGVLANSALDQRPDNLGNGDALSIGPYLKCSLDTFLRPKKLLNARFLPFREVAPT